MFERLLLLSIWDWLIIGGLSVLFCTLIILAMSIWENKEWSPVLRVKKWKMVKTGIDEKGNDVFEKVEYMAIVDWGIMRSIISGVLLGVFYSVASIIGISELGIIESVLGEISNIWLVRVVPIVISVFAGFFSDIFWEIIRFIGNSIRNALEKRKQRAKEASDTVTPPKEPELAPAPTQPEVQPSEQPKVTVQEVLGEQPIEDQL